MGRRRQQRLTFAFPVKLWLVDAGGNAKVENAYTLDVSSTGLRLFSRVLDRPRQEVVVGYLNKRARYRVVWVGERGTPAEGIAGLLCLEPDKSLFADLVPAGRYVDTVATERVPAAPPLSAKKPEAWPAGKRSAVRYECQGSAELRVGENAVRTWVPLSDISLFGCYLDTQTPLDVNTAVHLRVFLEGLEVKAAGTVKSRDPGSGMGVEFAPMPPEQRTNLELIIGKLAERATTLAAPSKPAAKDSPKERTNKFVDPRLVADWFERHDVLTRAQYEELGRRTRREVAPEWQD